MCTAGGGLGSWCRQLREAAPLRLTGWLCKTPELGQEPWKPCVSVLERRLQWHHPDLGSPLPSWVLGAHPACCGAEGGARTVKMLERRLDCLRMGVGVEEAAMVSMRSSRWLMLGVEGTEEE